MLNISVGKQNLEANNIVGICGDTGTGKSFLLSQIAYGLSLSTYMRFLLVDGVIMTSIKGETKGKYIQAMAVLADEYPVILLIDSLELLKECDQKFYETVRDNANAGKWNLIYTSQERAMDFNWNNNILLHTMKDAGIYKTEIIFPTEHMVENVTVSSL